MAAGKSAISSSISSTARNRSAVRSLGRKTRTDAKQNVAERSFGVCPRLVRTSGQVDRSTILPTATRIDYLRRWSRTGRYVLEFTGACRCSERPKFLQEWRRDHWMVGAPDVFRRSHLVLKRTRSASGQLLYDNIRCRHRSRQSVEISPPGPLPGQTGFVSQRRGSHARRRIFCLHVGEPRRIGRSRKPDDGRQPRSAVGEAAPSSRKHNPALSGIRRILITCEKNFPRRRRELPYRALCDSGEKLDHA